MSDADAPEPLFVAEDVDGATVARLSHREIRHPEAGIALGAQLKGLVEEHGRTRIVVDLGPCHYLGSTAFAAILNLARLVQQRGGSAALCHVGEDVLVGARIIGIERFAPIFDTEAQAIAHVSA